jgi:hypothetical protein
MKAFTSYTAAYNALVDEGWVQNPIDVRQFFRDKGQARIKSKLCPKGETLYVVHYAKRKRR